MAFLTWHLRRAPLLNGCDKVSNFAGIRIDHFKFDCVSMGLYVAITPAPDFSRASEFSRMSLGIELVEAVGIEQFRKPLLL